MLMFDVVEFPAKYHASCIIVSSCSGLPPCLTYLSDYY